MSCGFVQEILASIGYDPRGDQTSQGLFSLFNQKELRRRELEAGALVFYGGDEHHISHVAFGINHRQVMEAGGGGKKVTSMEYAAIYDAFIRIRPFDHRDDLIAILMPNYN